MTMKSGLLQSRDPAGAAGAGTKEFGMTRRQLTVAALAAGLASWAGFAPAADQVRAQSTGSQEQVYGSQLMTPQERSEHRGKMRAAKTAEERERVRKEHHERMKARARERGVTLPDEPPANGGGMGPGTGMQPGGGTGMGRGRSP